MALASSITLSAARISGIFDVVNLAQSAIPEGALVQYQTASTDDNDVLLPTAANSFNLAGVSLSAGQVVGGTSVAGSDFVGVQKLGRAKVLLAASTTVTRGQQCIAANALGHCTARTQWSTSAQVLGYFAQSHTSGGQAEFVMVDLALAPVEVAIAITGQCTGTITAATKYLTAPGDAVAAAQIPLFIAPYPMTLRYLSVALGTAPGGTDTVVFTVQKSSNQGTSWVSTALTATPTAGTGKSAQDLTDTATLAAGDWVAIQVVSSNVTAAAPVATVYAT